MRSVCALCSGCALFALCLPCRLTPDLVCAQDRPRRHQCGVQWLSADDVGYEEHAELGILFGVWVNSCVSCFALDYTKRMSWCERIALQCEGA